MGLPCLRNTNLAASAFPSVFNAVSKVKSSPLKQSEMLSGSELRHLSEQCPVNSSRTPKAQFAMQTTAFYASRIVRGVTIELMPKGDHYR